MTDNLNNPSLLCPVCGIGLVMSERQGVEIDYCAQCRGVWLDRGELDKIIERSAVEDRPRRITSDELYSDRHGGGHGKHGSGGHRRKSFLRDLFD